MINFFMSFTVLISTESEMGASSFGATKILPSYKRNDPMCFHRRGALLL